MQTASIMLQTLCVPCCCHCRYCLLSWDGRTVGADYERSEAYARRFYEWMREHRPELIFNFSFGYSMEHPALLRAVDFLRAIGSPGAEFLQFDGMRERNRAELDELMRSLQEHGVREVNFTFYGEQAYHDRFAARRGDFELVLRSAAAASEAGLETSAGIPLTHENAPQIDGLIGLLHDAGIPKLRLVVPHGEGRGAVLDSVRASLDDLAALSECNKKLLNRTIYKTEAEWLSEAFAPETHRSLLISLTPENIGALEQTPFDRVIADAEALDDAYYSAIPPLEVLAGQYGDRNSAKLYSRRDLFWHYQKRYIHDHGLRLYDVTDERQTGSRRY